MEIYINKRRINYIDQGNGEVFLVLHGWGASIPTVQPIINALLPYGRVIAIDLPGFGESEKPDRAYDAIDYVKVLWAFLDELKVKKFHVLGHSFGGKLSLLLASEQPNRIDKMVLIDSAGIRPPRQLKYYVKVYAFKLMKALYKMAFFLGNKEERLERYYRKHGSTDYRNADGVMRQTLVKVVNEDFTSRLKDIQAPTLLFWGSEDKDTPLYMGEKMELLIPDAGLVVAKGAGHYAYLDQYNLFVRVLHAFFFGR